MQPRALAPLTILSFFTIALGACQVLDAKQCIGNCSPGAASDSDTDDTDTNTGGSETDSATTTTGDPQSPTTGTSSGAPSGPFGTCDLIPSGGGKCLDELLEPGDICFADESFGSSVGAGANASIVLPSSTGGAPTVFQTRDGELELQVVTFGDNPYDPKSALHSLFLTEPLILVGSADINGDGATDLLARTGGPQPQLSFIELGPQHDILEWHAVVVFDDLVTVDIADFDGDGDLDIVTTRAPADGAPHMHVLQGDGMGGYGDLAGPELPFTEPAHALGALDLDGRADDLVFLTGPRVIRNVAGVQQDTVLELPPSLSARAVALADLDDDGRGDIVTLADNGEHDTSEVVVSLQTPEFVSTRYPVLCNAAALAVRDFDLDGHLDLVVVGAEGEVTVRRNDGAGGFAQLATSLVVPVDPDRVRVDQIEVPDLNGDGAPDLLVFGPGTMSASFTAP